MAALTISENDGTVTYTIGATLATGPYVVDFPYFLASEVVVKKVISGVETLLVVTTDYTLAGTAADDGFSAGAVTLTGAGLNNCDIVITRALATTKATNFPISGPLSIRALNTLFSRLFSWAQDLRRLYGTAFRFPAGEEALNAVAAAAATRKGYIPAYHATTGALTQSNLTLAVIEAQPANAAASAAAAVVSAAAALASQIAGAASAAAAVISAAAAAASAAAAAASAAALSAGSNIAWTGTNSHAGSETFTGALSVKDANLSIKDDVDATKILKFQASGITTGTTRTLTAPDADDTITGLAAAQTLTNKTVDAGSNSLGIPLVPQGRLTLETAVPVSSSDQTGKATIYYTPFVGGFIPVYDGTSFKALSFSELSNDTAASATNNAGAAAAGPYQIQDCFVWNNAGTNRLTRGPKWTASATATMTLATPCVVTWTAHGLWDGATVRFTTTGALYTGLAANTDYFVTKIDANTFKLSTTLANQVAGTFIATSGTQSGVHTAFNYTSVRGTGAATTELQLLNGIYVNKYNITNGPAATKGTYVGSVYFNASSQVDFKMGSRAAGFGEAIIGLWNAYNRVGVGGTVQASSSAWTVYAGWYPMAKSATVRATVVSGLLQEAFSARSCVYMSCDMATSYFSTVAFNGNNTTTSVAWGPQPSFYSAGGQPSEVSSFLTVGPFLGLGYMNGLENAVNYTSSYVNNNGAGCGLDYGWRY